MKLSELKGVLNGNSVMNSELTMRAASLKLENNSKSALLNSVDDTIIKLYCVSKVEESKQKVYDIFELHLTPVEVNGMSELFKKVKEKLCSKIKATSDSHQGANFESKDAANLLIREEMVKPSYFRQFKLGSMQLKFASPKNSHVNIPELVVKDKPLNITELLDLIEQHIAANISKKT